MELTQYIVEDHLYNNDANGNIDVSSSQMQQNKHPNYRQFFVNGHNCTAKLNPNDPNTR